MGVGVVSKPLKHEYPVAVSGVRGAERQARPVNPVGVDDRELDRLWLIEERAWFAMVAKLNSEATLSENANVEADEIVPIPYPSSMPQVHMMLENPAFFAADSKVLTILALDNALMGSTRTLAVEAGAGLVQQKPGGQLVDDIFEISKSS
ncbi:hypothetical protein PQX77_002215 [Marasmius sp. AFHP31]|nr:hypothetical protein PQX77_002215 [Marasmius sp. AFHP31]